MSVNPAIDVFVTPLGISIATFGFVTPMPVMSMIDSTAGFVLAPAAVGSTPY